MSSSTNMIVCIASAAFTVVINLVIIAFRRDYHRLSDSDRSALCFTAVAWGFFAIIFDVLCMTTVSNLLIYIVLLVFINIGLIACYQFFVGAIVKDSTETSKLTDDQLKANSHDQRLMVSTKTVNELLLMKHQDDGGGH